MSIINNHNKEVIKRMIDSKMRLVDIKLAKDVTGVFKEPTLLHAGPEIKWENMPDPMKGSCIGALIFEKLAKNEQEALDLLENNKIKFVSCHSVGFVGPMGGITSANMPVFQVINELSNEYAYCNLNEGIGKVLRFGAYGKEVIERLKWISDKLAPVLSEALKNIEGGLDLNSIVARAITMGDEFHQRNIAASMIFFKEISPYIINQNIDNKDKKEIIEFLSKTEQFFLNIAMAYCKAATDYARKYTEGTIVTAMARNGYEFGIKVSGLGDKWYKAPVNTPQGLLFSGYDESESCPDMGDSAITETYGFGGMSMIAAPGVTRFVGAGGFEDAYRASEEMQEICFENNRNFSIPTWDFKGIPTGIDVRRVVETGITPIINTGIAHKKAGIGQIGAGTVRVPLECFVKALNDLNEKYKN